MPTDNIKVKFANNVLLDSDTCQGLGDPTIGDGQVDITVLAEIKLWRQKYSHLENDGELPVGKGDDIGFTLLFGNDGELPCPREENVASVQDTLTVTSPISLKLMSLCICDEYEIWVVGDDTHVPNDYKIEPCYIFNPGTYTLELRKIQPSGPARKDFDIPCHYICCVSMLFQIEFPPCTECNAPCLSNQITNGSFETGNFSGWTTVIPSGADATVTTGDKGISPECGYYFALLESDTLPVSIAQSLDICEGRQIEGKVNFKRPDEQGDIASIIVYASNGDVVFEKVLDPTFPDWISWTSGPMPYDGEFTVVFSLQGDSKAASKSYLGIDCVEIV